MFLLTTATSLITVTCSASSGGGYAVKTHASYVDNNAGVIGPVGVNSSQVAASTATVVSSPGSGIQRNVRLLNIRNDHATDSCLITVAHTDGTTPVNAWVGTLLASETIIRDSNGVITKLDKNGVPVETLQLSTSGITVAGVTNTGQQIDTSIITPSALATDQNDYTPTGWTTARVVRLTASVTVVNITGFAAGQDGESKLIYNAGASGEIINLVDQAVSTASSAGNRIFGAGDTQLTNGACAELMYDARATSPGRWRVRSVKKQDSPSINGFRLTLRTGEPIPTVDTTAGTTLFFTPHNHGSITIYDGNAWVERNSAEISLGMTGMTTALPYDIYVHWTGTALALELLAWTNTTTRATALIRWGGVLVKSGDTTRRYVGTIIATGATTTNDTLLQRYVYNEYNQVERYLYATDTTTTWTYALTTIRQTRGSTANKVELCIGGVGCRPFRARANSNYLTSSTDCGVTYIGKDSITVAATLSRTNFNVNLLTTGNIWGMAVADLADVFVPGYHFLAWLENCNAAVSITFNGTVTPLHVGIEAYVLM